MAIGALVGVFAVIDSDVTVDNALADGVDAANPSLAAGEEADVDPQDEIEEAQKSVEEAKERVLDDAKRLRDIAQVCISVAVL